MLESSENDQSSYASQSLKVKVKAVELFRPDPLFYYVLFRKVIYIWVGFPDFREEQVENLI